MMCLLPGDDDIKILLTAARKKSFGNFGGFDLAIESESLILTIEK